MSDEVELRGPDLKDGVPLSEIPDGGMLVGHTGGKPVLLSRRGNEIFAIDAMCAHYGGPLSEGLVVGDTVRCPWHHACFNLRTGVALKAPALKPLGCWKVERRGGQVVVMDAGQAVQVSMQPDVDPATFDQSIVIVGAGAAADAAADMIRREGHTGSLTMISADESPPCDRPNLSKDYLAGNAPEEWIPLRAPSFYEEHDIRLILGQRVASIERGPRRVRLGNGDSHAYDKLLLATGASPIRLPPSVDDGRVHYLRTLTDSRAIIAAAEAATTALVIGASFIGLEVAAALRGRGLDVHVVAPEDHPLERMMGRALSDFIRVLHESKGVAFHLGRTVRQTGPDGVVLDNGERIPADLIVAGIGVRPNDDLATSAGLDVDRGVSVNEFLATSDPGIFAAGDVARYPDAHTGEHIRVEHWVHAQRQGQAAALNMLGAKRRYGDVPFFWSQHYDVRINYVGHAERWDDIELSGRPEARDCAVTFRMAGKTLAVATVGRDAASLEAEIAIERAQGIHMER